MPKCNCSVVNRPETISKSLLAVVFLVCVLPGVLSAEEIQLVASKDNTLYEDQSGLLSNGEGDYLYAGLTGTGFLRRALIEFDLSSIPYGSVVNSVSVRLTIDKMPSSPPTDFAFLHKVLNEWGEGDSNAGSPGGMGAASSSGDATWIHTFFSDTFWSSAGGDFVVPESALAPFNNFVPDPIVFQSAGLVSDVQGWLDNPSSNHGWLLIGDENTEANARRFYSRESVDTHPDDVPILTIDFTAPSVTDHLELTPVATSLSGPIGIVNAGDGSNRVFIIEQEGIIRILDTDSGLVLGTPFLDISGLVDDSGNEQGLLGLAFHPDYENNGLFFVYYTYDPPGTGLDRSRLARYQVSGGNPDVADTTATVLMEFDQEASNHNGGDMHFSTEGYLYIAVGDGGGSNQYENPQDVNSLKGKLLRIDVDATPSGAEKCGLIGQYAIPAGNAFPGASDGCDEILHLGFRNPWRFSFDAQTGEMMIGDVGQGAWEEVDYAAPGASGINFGWSCREGAHSFPIPPGTTCISATTDPVLEYPNTGFTGDCAVTGGYVYRGAGLPLQGRYVYGDYCSARIWIAERSGSAWTSEEWVGPASTLSSLTSFGQDEQCNLYVADRTAGAVYRIDDMQFIQKTGFEALNCQ